MEDIIERLTSGKDLSLNRNVNHNEYPAADDDDVFSTIPLTSECESFDELSRFLSALSANTSVRRVVFRESFFPLRRIRQHLSQPEFLSFLQGVGMVARDTLEIHPSMKGMVRGRLLASIIFPVKRVIPPPAPPSLKHLTAISSLTLIDYCDVNFLAHALSACDLLEQVILKNCFVSTFREEPLLNPLISTLATRPKLNLLDISCQNERTGRGITTVSRRRSDNPFPFFDAGVLRTLLRFRATTTTLTSTGHGQSSSSLESLRLCNLGLQDDHFSAIAKHLGHQQDYSSRQQGGPPGDAEAASRVSSLKHISLDENYPTQSGFDAIMMALNSKCQSVETVSLNMKEAYNLYGDPRPGIRLKDDILNQLIESNYHLKKCFVKHCFEDSKDAQQQYELQKLDFFLKINRCGRKNVFSNAAGTCNTKLWSRLTECVHDDPSTLYYFLRSMPGIILSSA